MYNKKTQLHHSSEDRSEKLAEAKWMNSEYMKKYEY